MRLPAELEFRKKKEMGASAYDYGMQEQDKCVSKKCYDDEDDDEEEDDYLYPRHPTPPDGGWAWVVMLGSFMCLFTVDGTCFSYGPLMPSLAKEFEASHSKVAWVGSTLAGSYLLAGPAVAAMCAKYGNRKVCIIGSIIACIGLLMSVHSESVDMMIATYGVIGGMGLGMVHLPAVVAVGHWFKKKRAFATGCAFVGAGLGQFVFPPLITWLVETYSWRGALYIMAGIHLNCAVYGMTFVPVNRWLAGSKPRRPINRKVEICRGDIMTALIESKKRERTISNGSLDNCVITRDNVLIKLDPKLFEGKRNNSIIARFRRQLGFSSQSLASSKNSLQGIPSIVIDAVHKDMNMKAAAAAAMAANNSGSVSLTGSPIYRPSGSHGVTRVQQLSGMVGLEKRGSLPMMSQGSNPAYLSSTKIESPSKESVNGSALALSQARVSKTQSCDVIPTSKMSPGPADSSASIDGENPNPVLSRSASDLQTHHTQFLPFGPGSLDGTDLRIQSIQLLSNGTSCAQELAAAKARGLRCRSSRSESSTHSFGGFSYTSPGSVHGSTVLYSSAGSLPQIQATLEEMEQLQASCEAIERSFPAECVHFVVNMLNLELLVNPVFLKFALSTFAVIMGFYIPFFFLPSKGEEVGMPYGESEFLICVVGVTNTVGRILSGWLADRPWVSSLYLYVSTLVISGLAMLFLPFCESSTSLCILAAIFGLTIAVSVSLRSILLVEFLGLDQLAKSFGLLSLVNGIGALIGAPIAGKLLDQTNNTDLCFFMAGGLTVLSGLIMLPTKCLKSQPSPDEEKATPVGSPQLVQACGPITQTLTMEKLTATSVV